MSKVTKIKGLIDRIEDGIAVVYLGDDEDVTLEIPTCYLPDSAAESDLVTFKISLNSRKTKEAKEKVAAMIKRL
ncbi:hypothetical protein A2276_05270 [candidate division WOR-1 bacterium RIFOXYA12_FULL_43_27]|uniref:DUF3006 domain-containing protein n=1 Tax=candidate division WOR-1 bacterium RIFOXYC2_FULL_46_14 TaxID=1802587 RepID=A0A1F4U3N4_UNCSA|nr:MAG: hypothetical protein A2276_05270 [candidate division WOR-1 bacterium RIFOXYA12_FULL_43_27]OGC20076.1 MAG: hypothetical protein A2292_03275 [candidate division WOR-1 bacterium RIFOXYB2_FULL_46_45]OGC32188.1 MAG: hypothetical protein A2232_08175 [candidate division WOR-1 bacterium RIFOXYA2_FULL_46_56]OGC39588.1 MAG: hypothetical protein A2438_08540 [candidate division WOR-1 bacterium RIFOXYC2_FULL_46_14]